MVRGDGKEQQVSELAGGGGIGFGGIPGLQNRETCGTQQWWWNGLSKGVGRPRQSAEIQIYRICGQNGGGGGTLLFPEKQDGPVPLGTRPFFSTETSMTGWE